MPDSNSQETVETSIDNSIDSITSLEEIVLDTAASEALTRENLRRLVDAAPPLAGDNLEDGVTEPQNDGPSGP